MSERVQAAMLWWAIIFVVIFAVAWVALCKMAPPPPASWSADQVAAFYLQNGASIRLGAVIGSWTSAFLVPFTAVIAIQIARLEKGVPIWAIMAFGGGLMASLFLVLPMMLWGVTAYDPTRPAQVTALMHQFAVLSLVATDQYFIFKFAAIAYVSLTQKADPHSPFPRWLGYFTIWCALLFEAGAIAFVAKTGPFAWNGLFVFYLPFTAYTIWFICILVQPFKALKRQAADAQ